MAEQLTPKRNEISVLGQKTANKELTSAQGLLDLGIEVQAEVDGIGMGVLKDGTPFLTGRGLARLVGLENLHIRTISQEWNGNPPPPRTEGVKALLAKRGITLSSAHIETSYRGVTVHAFPEAVCLAVLEYYAFDAPRPREVARDNYRILAGKALRDLIYSQVGYDPSGKHSAKFEKWHERIALNYQSAPKGYFHVFNEAHTIIYELIMAGAEIGDKMVVDISIGQCWSKHWTQTGLDHVFERGKYPHRYPSSHPQAASNPQESWCYPIGALPAFRDWLQNEYLEGGRFKNYLKTKVDRGELPPSVAQLAIATLAPAQLTAA